MTPFQIAESLMMVAPYVAMMLVAGTCGGAL